MKNSFLVVITLVSALVVSCEGSKDRLERIENAYSNGNIQELYEIDSEGKIQGEYLAFYEDGTPYKKEFYSDSVKNGKCWLYYEDGLIKSELKYDNGKLVDTAKFYNYNGVLTEKEIRNKKGRLMKKERFDLKGQEGAISVYHTPSEKIIAWQSFNRYNIAIDSASNYLEVRYKDWKIAKLVPHAPDMDKVDSVYVHVIPDMSFISGSELKAKRSVKYKNPKDIVFEIRDEDYIDGYHVNLVLVTYAYVNGELVVREFPIQGNKSRRLPKNNMYSLN